MKREIRGHFHAWGIRYIFISKCVKDPIQAAHSIPITGGHDFGRRTEETVAIGWGASRTTFFFDDSDFSPSLFLFLWLRSDILH